MEYAQTSTASSDRLSNLGISVQFFEVDELCISHSSASGGGRGHAIAANKKAAIKTTWQ